MPNTLDTHVLVSTPSHYVVRITNESDGTDESAVAKVDKSGLTGLHGREPLALDIDMIEYQVSGFNYVTLHWDHATNDEIDVLAGAGEVDYRPFGGLRDPTINDGTGDILLTTDGAADGDSYDITLSLRLRPDD